jgi:hypothetical protein
LNRYSNGSSQLYLKKKSSKEEKKTPINSKKRESAKSACSSSQSSQSDEASPLNKPRANLVKKGLPEKQYKFLKQSQYNEVLRKHKAIPEVGTT